MYAYYAMVEYGFDRFIRKSGVVRTLKVASYDSLYTCEQLLVNVSPIHIQRPLDFVFCIFSACRFFEDFWSLCFFGGQ